MNPGTLRNKIEIQNKTITQDSELNAIETWVTWKTLSAQPMPKTGKEYYKLNTVNSDITEAFKIRYIADVTPQQRVKFKSKYFEIIDVINVDERDREIIITCKAVI